MARMGGSTQRKRTVAPAFWKIPRKEKPFTVATAPGPHPYTHSYALGVLVRDILRLTERFRETRAAIGEGSILIDGVVRRDPHFPVGLMDVIEAPAVKKVWRIVPSERAYLWPAEIPEAERRLKLVKVTRKLTVRDGRTQIGFHDGRSLLLADGMSLAPGDTALLEVPTQQLRQTVKLAAGSKVVIVRGQRAGREGKLREIKAGSITRPRTAIVEFPDGVAELPTDALFAIGVDKPLLTVYRAA